MKAIEVMHVGQRNAKPATSIPVPTGIDPYVFLALYLDEQMQDGFKVVGSYGNADTFGLCKRDGALDAPVLRVKLIDIAEVVEASKAS